MNATNTAPTVSLTAPAANASVTLPATVTLSANASDVEVNTPVTKVDFYQGATLIGSDTTAPYSLSWTPTTAGTYSLTAKATDSGGMVTTSTAVSITVKTAVTAIYYIQGDHLGTPRIVTDSANNVVWRNHPLGEPFGLSPVEEDPDADGQKFVLNLRFAGQYYDKETGTHYNMQRDYDPAAGRYLQSDPIGLAGGANTYAYVGSNPLQYIDPLGLEKCRLPTDDLRKLGPKPDDMEKPHLHHIVMENAHSRWNSGAQKYVTDAQAILQKHGIDLNKGIENFTWAENRGHSQAYAKEVLRRLELGDRGGKDGVVKALDKIREVLSKGDAL